MTYQYTMCGLDYVFLRSGYRKHETEYGEGISIEHADQLDRAIALFVTVSYARLRGPEVRFFRSLIHLSQAELAALLGVKRVTVARWEGAARTPIPGPADRLIRLIVAEKLFGVKSLEVILGLLAEIEDEAPEQIVMEYVPDENREPRLFPSEDQEREGWHKTRVA